MVVKINVDLVFTVFVNHPLGGAILNDVFTQAFHFHHGSQGKRGSTGNTGFQFHTSGTIHNAVGSWPIHRNTFHRNNRR